MQVASTILLISGAAQIWGAIWGFFYPKVFFWASPALEKLIHPFPILQMSNLLSGLIIMIIECGILHENSFLRRSMLFRIQLYMSCSVGAFLNYQTTDVALYILIGCILLTWGYCEGEQVLLQEEAKKSKRQLTRSLEKSITLPPAAVIAP